MATSAPAEAGVPSTPLAPPAGASDAHAAPAAEATDPGSGGPAANALGGTRRTGWGAVGVPIFNYNPDLGVGLGAVGALVDRGGGKERPYRTYLAGQLLLTTRGVHSHQLWVDALRLFGSPLRLQLFATYFDDRGANWFGVGQGAAEDLAAMEANPRHHQYRLREVPSARASLGFPLTETLMLRLGARVKRAMVDAYPGSLLDATRPPGLGASWANELTLALTYDSRDTLVEPARGMYHELFARAAGPALGSDWSYQGLTLALRGYRRVSPRVTLAGRLVGDLLLGDPPFFELMQFGGTERLQGLGGALSLRGVRQGRFVGKGKLLVNLEARLHLGRVDVFGATVDFGMVGFTDGGQAFAEIAMEPLRPVLGLGGGLRLVWNESVVLRLDAAYPLGDRDGPRFYLQVGQLF